MAIAIKEKRIEFRVSDEAKKIIEQAATLSNISVSSYILSVVLKQAKLDLAQCGPITLNKEEANALQKNLDNPPEPNKELKKLLKK